MTEQLPEYQLINPHGAVYDRVRMTAEEAQRRNAEYEQSGGQLRWVAAEAEAKESQR